MISAVEDGNPDVEGPRCGSPVTDPSEDGLERVSPERKTNNVFKANSECDLPGHSERIGPGLAASVEGADSSVSSSVPIDSMATGSEEGTPGPTDDSGCSETEAGAISDDPIEARFKAMILMEDISYANNSRRRKFKKRCTWLNKHWRLF